MQLHRHFSLILLIAIIAGGLFGYQFHDQALLLKPFGDLFIYLLLFTVIPLGAFSIAAAISQLNQSGQLLTLSRQVIVTFLVLGLCAASFMLLVVSVFPLTSHYQPFTHLPEHLSLIGSISHKISIQQIAASLSHDHMLALIIVSIIIGIAISRMGKRGIVISRFLQSGSDVFLQAVSLIMYYAPIGFFAYFASIVSSLGAKTNWLENYFRVSITYYAAAIFYFFVAFSLYAYLAGKWRAVKLFWTHISTLVFTALATCSSAACLPVNLQTAKEMGLAPAIYETVIPLGTILHKQGSILGGMTKIAFIFSLYHVPMTNLPTVLSALLVSVLVGTVMGAIPGGGMLGEMLIISYFGFPPQALVMIVAISVIIDPLATVLNVTGNTLACLLIDKSRSRRRGSRQSDRSNI